jgi:RNA polymerase sigma-70 factor (ECF subfamily)
MVTQLEAARLYSRFSGLVRRIVTRRLGNDSEANDVVQDAFVQIFRSLHQVESPHQVEHWVARVTAHTVYKELRRRRRRLRLLPEDAAEAALACVGYDADLEGREALHRTARALEQLSPEHSRLLWHRLFECQTLDELAVQRGWSASMLKRRLLRARIRFERLAEADGLLQGRLVRLHAVNASNRKLSNAEASSALRRP